MQKSELKVIQTIEKRFGTPFFLFDMDMLGERVKKIKNIVNESCELCYAIKANPFMAEYMSKAVGHIEVCSSGELNLCIANHIHAKSIILSGVYKEENEIEKAIRYGVETYTAESTAQMMLLREQAEKNSVKIKVIPRITTGNQFGMDVKELKHILDNYYPADQYTAISGIHYFVGTQRNKSSEQISDISFLLGLLDELRQQYSFTPDIVEYGPGLAVPYFVNNDFDDTLLPLKMLMEDASALLKEYKVRIEMGRFFVAETGCYVSKVVDIKTNMKTHYAILDGGIHHLNYYGGNMGMRSPIVSNMNRHERNTQEWTLCGSLCTTADIIVRDLNIDIEPGDILVFQNTGAYTMTETPILFLSHDMPHVFALENQSVRILREPVATYKFNCLFSPTEKITELLAE